MADFVGAIRGEEKVMALLEPKADLRASIRGTSDVIAVVSPSDLSADLLSKVELQGLLEEKSK